MIRVDNRKYSDMRLTKLILILAVTIVTHTKGTGNPQATAQKVLNDLYRSNGNLVYLKPRVVVTDDTTHAARYLRRTNKIEVSNRVFNVCRAFGKDSLAALAFVLGHEMAHAFQEDNNSASTSFLVYDKLNKDSKGHEESADVLGVFISYLAGYQTMDILEELIASIYMEFGLKHELRGYPSLRERQETTQKVKGLSGSLIDIFEGASYLVSIGEFQLAEKSFAFVEQWYSGKEIYNNLGYCKVMQALNIKETNIYPYVFPFELYWDTRISKPLASRGTEELTEEEKKTFDELLMEAIAYFTLANKMDPTEVGADINIMSTMIIQGKSNEALAYGEDQGVELRAYLSMGEIDYDQRYESAKAIALYESGMKDDAIALWKQLSSEENGPMKLQAIQNLAILSEGDAPQARAQVCDVINLTENQRIDDVRLHRPAPEGDWILLDEKEEYLLCLNEKENSLVYTFQTNEGYFSLQRIKNIDTLTIEEGAVLPPQVLTNNGQISSCNSMKIALLLDNSGSVKEWAKYY